MYGMLKANNHGYAVLPLNIHIHPLFMDIHHSVMDIRDLKYKYLATVMYIYHSFTAVHDSKLLYP